MSLGSSAASVRLVALSHVRISCAQQPDLACNQSRKSVSARPSRLTLELQVACAVRLAAPTVL